MSSQTPPCSKRKHFRCEICQEDFYEYGSLLVHKITCNISENSHLQPLNAELLSPDLTQATGAPGNQTCLDGSMLRGTSPAVLMQEFEAGILLERTNNDGHSHLQSLSAELLSPGLTQATEVPGNQSCLDGSMPRGTSPGDLMQEFEAAMPLKRTNNDEHSHLQSLNAELMSLDLTQATGAPGNQSCLDESIPRGTSPGDLMQEFDAAILLKRKAIQLVYEAAMKANEFAKATEIIKSQKESALKTLKEALHKLQLVKDSNASKKDKYMAKERLIHATKAAEELSEKENNAIADLEKSVSYQRIAIEKAIEASEREQSAFKAAVSELFSGK